jgi:hypothetical protein
MSRERRDPSHRRRRDHDCSPDQSRDRIRAMPVNVSAEERFGNTEELTGSTALE